jgi:hypothetical protein
MAMDFNSLKNTIIPAYTLRTDEPFVAQLDDIIQQAIIRVYNSASDIGFELYYTFNLPINTFLITKPVNWRETISLSIADANNNKIFLQERTYEYCKTYLPNTNVVGIPKYYSDIPTNPQTPTSYTTWFVAPSADADYVVNVIYLGIPLFNALNPINFLTIRYPTLLLYSCLMEAYLFLNNEELRSKYETMFGKELETINAMNSNRTTDRTVNRDKS